MSFRAVQRQLAAAEFYPVRKPAAALAFVAARAIQVLYFHDPLLRAGYTLLQHTLPTIINLP
jgi:hypothetical protein